MKHTGTLRLTPRLTLEVTIVTEPRTWDSPGADPFVDKIEAYWKGNEFFKRPRKLHWRFAERLAEYLGGDRGILERLGERAVRG